MCLLHRLQFSSFKSEALWLRYQQNFISRRPMLRLVQTCVKCMRLRSRVVRFLRMQKTQGVRKLSIPLRFTQSVWTSLYQGGSPGLVVMGDDSCSRGCGFKSRRHILDGHFFTLICCTNCIVCLKRLKINKKEAGVGPFKKIESWRKHRCCAWVQKRVCCHRGLNSWPRA